MSSVSSGADRDRAAGIEAPRDQIAQIARAACGRRGPARSPSNRCRPWRDICCRCRRPASRRAWASSARGNSAARRPATCRTTSPRECPPSPAARARSPRFRGRRSRRRSVTSDRSAIGRDEILADAFHRPRSRLRSSCRFAPAARGSSPPDRPAPSRSCGETRRKKRPMPVSVPPEPTPTTTASTSCSICSQISGPVVVLMRQRIGGIGELVDVERAASPARCAAAMSW